MLATSSGGFIHVGVSASGRKFVLKGASSVIEFLIKKTNIFFYTFRPRSIGSDENKAITLVRGINTQKVAVNKPDFRNSRKSVYSFISCKDLYCERDVFGQT